MHNILPPLETFLSFYHASPLGISFRSHIRQHVTFKSQIRPNNGTVHEKFIESSFVTSEISKVTVFKTYTEMRDMKLRENFASYNRKIQKNWLNVKSAFSDSLFRSISSFHSLSGFYIDILYRSLKFSDRPLSLFSISLGSLFRIIFVNHFFHFPPLSVAVHCISLAVKRSIGIVHVAVSYPRGKWKFSRTERVLSFAFAQTLLSPLKSCPTRRRSIPM